MSVAKKATKPIILSSPFFRKRLRRVDCHVYKGSRIKPFTALNEHAICGGFFLFPPLLSSSLVIKFEQNQIAGGKKESGGGVAGGRGFNESTFCWFETSK